MNICIGAGFVLGACILASTVMGAGSGIEGFKRNTALATAEMADVQSAKELETERLEHFKRLTALVDKGTTLILLRQISASSTDEQLKTMGANIKPGSRITVGGLIGSTPAVGTIVTDFSGNVGMVGEGGLIENPFKRGAKHLPMLSTDQIAKGNSPINPAIPGTGIFRNADLYATPPEQLAPPQPIVTQEQTY